MAAATVWTPDILVQLRQLSQPFNTVEVFEMRTLTHRYRSIAAGAVVASFALAGSVVGVAQAAPANADVTPVQATPAGPPAPPAPAPGIPMPNPDPKQIPLPVPVPGGGA